MSIFNSDLKPEEISSLLKDVKSSIHFVGILGSGMYPLARILHSRGYDVSGSDDNAASDCYIDSAGIRISRMQGRIDGNVKAVIYSLAISETNSEIIYAKASGIPLISRAQLLGFLMSAYKTRISVSGSHGKSTTTALIDHILDIAEVDHTSVSGAKLTSGEIFKDSGGDIFLAEACEYKDSFLRLCPTHQLITAVELDHTDYFPTLDAIYTSFLKAAKRADVILCNKDDPVSSFIADKIRAKNSELCNTVYTYGASAGADYCFCDVKRYGGLTDFLIRSEHRVYNLKTSLIGKYNLYNITAAVAMADILGIGKEYIEKAVSSFLPIDRRMSLIARSNGVPIYYDYAHHPSEIRAAVSALKEEYGAVTVIFRPHTYSRTKSLWNEFIAELSKADFTILLDIYPAREKRIPGVDSKILAKSVDNCIYSNNENAAELAVSLAKGAIALLGAGEVDDVKRDLIRIAKKTDNGSERR